jgi:hypothetical protein
VESYQVPYSNFFTARHAVTPLFGWYIWGGIFAPPGLTLGLTAASSAETHDLQVIVLEDGEGDDVDDDEILT